MTVNSSLNSCCHFCCLVVLSFSCCIYCCLFFYGLFVGFVLVIFLYVLFLFSGMMEKCMAGETRWESCLYNLISHCLFLLSALDKINSQTTHRKLSSSLLRNFLGKFAWLSEKTKTASFLPPSALHRPQDFSHLCYIPT